MKNRLLKFTTSLVELYNKGEVHAPCHFNGGNADQLIGVFQHHKKNDWIFSTWRSHWHWLLSGGNPRELKQQIVDGHSMHVFGDKFFTSSIVGGTTPIALGVAYALKLKKSENKVFCFIGDMAASGGLAQECFRYAKGHNLPILYVVENNEISVTTPTQDVWGRGKKDVVDEYTYTLEWPHAGTGKFILF